MTDWNKVAADHWNAKPHPDAPGVSIGEYPQAVRLATMARFGGHATPQEAEAFHKEFKQTGMQPAEFEHYLDVASKNSFVFHGRPPSMMEMSRFKEASATPSQMREFYAQLPDQHYPEVPAGEMVKHLKAAEPWARMHIGRAPVKAEGAYFFHSGDKPANYYQQVASADAQKAQEPSQGGPSVQAVAR